MPFRRGESIKLRITPECVDRLFVLMNNNTTITYKYKRCKHAKTKSCIKIFDVDSFAVLFSSFFLLWGDLKIDLMFFIQLIWWIRTREIFKKFDQTNKRFQIFLYTLLNLFDSTNLIKLIWLCISGDLTIVDWFK